MNNKQRKEIDKALGLLSQALSIIETLKDEEREKADNLTDALQATEKGQKIEEAASALENAHSSLEDVIGSLETVKE